MPFEVKGRSSSFNCVVCGRLIRGEGIQLKTCCVNKPIVFCSEKCRRAWEAKWLKRQEQVIGRGKDKRHYIP